MSDSLSPGARAATFKPAHVVRYRADDRAAWLERRKQDVTASAIAALLGEHPYQTAYGLYCQKAGLTDEETVEPIITETSISLPPMMRGTELEDVAPRLIRKLRPTWTIEPSGYYYRDPAARMGATPDFWAVDPARPGFGSIQVKTCDQLTLRRTWRTEEGAIEPPLFIAIQAVVEAALTGAAWAEVAVLATGFTLDLHLIPIPIHAGIMERLRDEVAAFWRSVEAGTPPNPDYARDACSISALYQQDNGQELDLRADNHLPALLAMRDAEKAAIKAATESVETIDAEFKHKLGPFEAGLLADGRRVTWKTQHRRAFAVESSSSRVLRFSKAR